MRTGHLTSAHSPFDTRIFHKECRALVEAGYEVVLVAPHDRDEVVEGVRIRALPRPRGRAARMTCTVGQVLRAALAEDAAIYHFHDPELIPVGLLLKLRGKQVVYDVHEDLPRQILSKHWIPRRLRTPIARLMEGLEAVSVRAYDGISAATPAIARRFPETKTVTVQNFPLIGELADAGAKPYSERGLMIAYVGGIAAIRGARETVEAMELLPASLGAQLLLAGSFSPPNLETELQQMPGWRRVRFLGWRGREDIRSLLAEARIGLVTLHPVKNYLDSYPVKLFEYMSAGLPVIASDFPLWRKIVEGAKCGVLVDPLDPRAIAEAIQWLLEHPREAEAMGRRGREAVLAHYNWDGEAEKLLALYKRLAK